MVTEGPCVSGTGEPQKAPREESEGEGRRAEGANQGGGVAKRVGGAREGGPMGARGRGRGRLLGDPEEARREGADGFSREEAGEGARKR